MFSASPIQNRVRDVFIPVSNIEAAYTFMKERGVELVTEIENGHWFVFHDPDGNKMMVCA